MSKSTKIEYDNRVFTVLGWMLNSVPDSLILRNCIEPAPKGWGVTMRQAKRYLAEAYATFKAGRHADIEDRRMKKIAELEQLKRTLKDVHKGTPQGITAILRVDQEINRLEDYNPATRHIIEGNKDKPIHHAVTVSVVQTGKRIATSEEDVDI